MLKRNLKFTMLTILCLTFVFAIVPMANATLIEGDTLDGGSWGQSLRWDYRPDGANLMNLFIRDGGTEQFEKQTGLGAGWNYYQSDNGLFAQIFKDTGPAPNETYTQWFTGNKTQHFYMDWEENKYNFQTGDIQILGRGCLEYVPGNGWHTGGYGGPTDPTAPVPIPGAVYLLGSGLVGLVSLRRRKLAKTN